MPRNKDKREVKSGHLKWINNDIKNPLGEQAFNIKPVSGGDF